MSDDNTTPLELEGSFAALASYNVDGDVVKEAVTNGILAVSPQPVGDHAMLVSHPKEWVAEIIDLRPLEDFPRSRAGAHAFTRWQSLTEYVNTYKDATSLVYVKDINGMGAAALTGDHDLATVVLDEHPSGELLDGRPDAANRSHKAILRMRPTPAARRWGAALGAGFIDQEVLLDLVVDGIGEIAEPPGADLRDLVSDLHAVRTTEARSVIRTGGQTTVEVADNVALHAGTGNTLTIPEKITLVFKPWTAVDDDIVLTVKVKAKIAPNSRVVFALSAPELDTQLAEVVSNIAALIGESTDLVPLWTP